mgnify:CR=1 FL=1
MITVVLYSLDLYSIIRCLRFFKSDYSTVKSDVDGLTEALENIDRNNPNRVIIRFGPEVIQHTNLKASISCSNPL